MRIFVVMNSELQWAELTGFRNGKVGSGNRQMCRSEEAECAK